MKITFHSFIKHNPNAIALKQDYVQLFEDLANLTPLIGHLSTPELSQKVTGHYSDMHQRNNVVMHFYPRIDTRLFTAKWRHAYVVFGKQEHSLHFFDRYGKQSYQVTARDTSVLKEFENRLRPYLLKNAPLAKSMSFSDPKPAKPYKKTIDSDSLQEEWKKMTNVHQAGRILKLYGNDNLAVYRALGQNFAIQVETTHLLKLLKQVKHHSLKIMYFARNTTSVQCFAGQLESIESTDSTITLTSERLDSTIQLDHLGETWLIKKPTDVGWIHSLSIFNPDGENVITLTDFRNRTTPEKPEWLGTLSNVYPSITWN